MRTCIRFLAVNGRSVEGSATDRRPTVFRIFNGKPRIAPIICSFSSILSKSLSLELLQRFTILVFIMLALSNCTIGQDNLTKTLPQVFPIDSGVYAWSRKNGTAGIYHTKIHVTFDGNTYIESGEDKTAIEFKTPFRVSLLPTPKDNFYIVQIYSLDPTKFYYFLFKENSDKSGILYGFDIHYIKENLKNYLQSDCGPLSICFNAGMSYAALAYLVQSDRGIDYSHPIHINRISGEPYFALGNKIEEGEIIVGYEGGLRPLLSPSENLKINGHLFIIKNVNTDSKSVILLGTQSAMTPGLATIETSTGTWRLWYENHELQAFTEPYKDSYAILAAIDDYDRILDPLNRGPTGFRPLKNMVERADELRVVLEGIGFPRDHIKVLYNADATKQNIENALYEFWPNGEHAGADRLFFYFGGHGGSTHGQGTGYLVTYDFQKGRPQTGMLMSSIVAEHFPNIQSNAVFVALDACDAGMALPGMLDVNPDQSSLARFATLAQIRAQTSQKARNILVAGTGDEPALDDGGGVFTRALISGLRGEADLFGVGVVQFDELSLYVERQVTAWAAAYGISQVPRPFIASQYGNGRVVFPLRSWN